MGSAGIEKILDDSEVSLIKSENVKEKKNK